MGVSRNDVIALKYWAKRLRVTFPLLSTISGCVGNYFGAEKPGEFIFERLTVTINKRGIVRYMKDGSPNFDEIFTFLKELNEEQKE